MQPKAISYSALSSFENCPFQYMNRFLLKKYKDGEKDDKRMWGDEVHTAFDYRQSIGQPLPAGMAEHEPFMLKLAKHEGIIFTEMKGALDLELKPIDFFSANPFMRVVIDFLSVIRNGEHALSVDYKSGKYREGMERQLMMNTIYVFHLFPKVNIVDNRYYWTSTKTETRHVWSREQEGDLWDVLLPTIKQYKTAYRTDTWQKRKSGLCHGYCEVTDCENWEPKRPGR